MVPESDSHRGSGLLGHGWTPSPRLRATFFLVIGVTLVLHPLVGGLPDAVGLDSGTTYRAAEITPDGGDIRFEWLDGRGGSVRGQLYVYGDLTLIDCLADRNDEYCALESSLTDDTATVDLEPTLWGGYTYHDRFYERVVRERGPGVTLGLRPVPAETVLEEVSIPARDWPEPVRRAVETGRVTVDGPVSSTGAVLSRDGNYYLVLPTTPVDRDEPAGPVYTAAFTAAGLALLRRGRRRYPT